ncbi:MAG: hypothetical protein AB9866_04410 [Syntrophobacteraceae bacterium]
MRKPLSLILTIVFFLVVFFTGKGWATPVSVEDNTILEIKPDVSNSEPPKADTLPTAKIPNRPALMYVKKGINSRFEIFFLDLKYDYDLVDFEYYRAWCLDKNKKLKRNTIHYVRLYNTYEHGIPADVKIINWNQINFIINQKNVSKSVIQEAIWHLTNNKNKLSIEAQQLVKEAEDKGKDYVPGEGDLLGIICYPDRLQPILLEYTIPPKAATFDVAPAFFEPPLAVSGAGVVPPIVPPIIPPIIIPPNTPEPYNPPDKPKPVSEPCTILLLGGGLAAYFALKKVRSF